MVVDSTISAFGRACSRTSSWTRLLAQITTSAPPMSPAPLTVNRSGAPGPAPINQTLAKPETSSGEDNSRQIRSLTTDHLPRGHYFLAFDPEPGTVHGVFDPPPGNPEHLPKPASALVANHRLEPGERLPERLFPGRERQERQPLVALEQNRPAARSQ